MYAWKIPTFVTSQDSVNSHISVNNLKSIAIAICKDTT